jgi:hypothetical protein
MNAIYVLILTTYMTGKYNDVPTVTQTATPGFSRLACENAGEIARNSRPHGLGRYENYAIVTYQCSPLSLEKVSLEVNPK